MVFDYYYRLSSKDQEIYRHSDAVRTLRLETSTRTSELVNAIRQALQTARRKRVETDSGELGAFLTAQFSVPPVTICVLSKRPSHNWGELHGLYKPSEDHRLAAITLWMRTAHHRRIVAFRTFLRTLLHEFCHHLDYEHFKFSESFHTEGFYQRESSLFRQLVRGVEGTVEPSKATTVSIDDARKRDALHAIRELLK